MDRFRNASVALILFTAVLAAPVSAHQDNDGLHRLTTSVGGVAFEVVGQVTNLPPASPGQPATSQQYGYLSTINGLSADQVFNTSIPTLQNETTARFTFFTDAITERVISRQKDQFRQFYSGVPPTLAPPSGVFAGYAVVIERNQSDKD